MRLALALVLAALGAGLVGAAAQDIRIDRISIVATGIFRAERAGTERAPGTATGRRHILVGTELIRSTTRIEATVGVHFGMQFRIEGRPNKSPVRLTSVTQYPAPGLKNPDTGEILRRGEHTLGATIGVVNYRGYEFEHAWELVPGTWILELWYGGRMLARQAFQVVRP